MYAKLKDVYFIKRKLNIVSNFDIIMENANNGTIDTISKYQSPSNYELVVNMYPNICYVRRWDLV